MYGLPENFELYLTAILWWASILILFVAHKYRKMWNVGEMLWVFLFLAFLSFGVRKAVQLTDSPLLNAARYVFGVWSAIFFLSTFVYLSRKLYGRKEPAEMTLYLPFAACLMIAGVFVYAYYAGNNIAELDRTMSDMEGIVWITAGAIIIYTTYMLGTRSTGEFVKVYLLAQIALYCCIIWKILKFVNPENFANRAIFEMLFAVFATMSVYALAMMFKNLYVHMYGGEHDNKG